MHSVVRWILRNVLLLFPEEWRKAKQDMHAIQAAHKIQSSCEAELYIFRVALTDLDRLQVEASRAISRFPAAQGLIVEMLQER
ncbi:MAG: hypothetical protein ACXWOL_05285, partial [Ktedonobacteraceae bacterium]